MSLATRLVEIGAFKTGEFELASGATSTHYVDVKEALSDPALLRAMAMHGKAHTPGRDAVAGTVLGGVPLATAVALEAGLPLLMVRPEPKAHGTGNQVEGRLEPGADVLVVEDVVTSGGSVLAAVEALRAAGATVRHVLCAVDRREGGRELLKENDITLHALVTLDELIHALEVTQ